MKSLLYVMTLLIGYSQVKAEMIQDGTVVPVGVGTQIFVEQQKSMFAQISTYPQVVLSQNGNDYFIQSSLDGGDFVRLSSVKSYIGSIDNCLVKDKSKENGRKICVGDSVKIDWMMGLHGANQGKVIGIGRLPTKKIMSNVLSNELLIEGVSGRGQTFQTTRTLDQLLGAE